jgi:hypothetical protein
MTIPLVSNQKKNTQSSWAYLPPHLFLQASAYALSAAHIAFFCNNQNEVTKMR